MDCEANDVQYKKKRKIRVRGRLLGGWDDRGRHRMGTEETALALEHQN